MTRYQITHQTTYDYVDIVSVCHNLVHLTPRSLPHQLVESSELTVEPKTSHRSRRVDYFGNTVDYLQIEQPHKTLSITSHSTINILDRDVVAANVIMSDSDKSDCAPRTPNGARSWEQTVDLLANYQDSAWFEAYQYVLPSPRVTPSVEALRYARPSFPPGRDLVDAAKDLMHRIHEDFEFDSKASTVLTPTAEVFRTRRGVCQDFAHLQIACLRSLGLSARYVSGYLRTYPPPGRQRLVGADASHAWISLFIGPGEWIELDPTNDVTPRSDHIVVAYGRDFSDVSPIDGVFIGGGDHTLRVSVDVAPIP